MQSILLLQGCEVQEARISREHWSQLLHATSVKVRIEGWSVLATSLPSRTGKRSTEMRRFIICASWPLLDVLTPSDVMLPTTKTRSHSDETLAHSATHPHPCLVLLLGNYLFNQWRWIIIQDHGSSITENVTKCACDVVHVKDLFNTHLSSAWTVWTFARHSRTTHVHQFPFVPESNAAYW